MASVGTTAGVLAETPPTPTGDSSAPRAEHANQPKVQTALLVQSLQVSSASPARGALDNI